MKRSTPLFIIILGTIVFIALFILSRYSPTGISSGKLQVSTSFYPLYYFAQQIAGDKADVYNLTPSGAEPHDYEPTGQDLARITDSRLVFLNGGKLEPWGDKVRQIIDPDRTIVVLAGENLATQLMIQGESAVTDPHTWLSPLLARSMVEKMTEGFIAADSLNADYYQARSLELQSRLSALDAQYQQGLSLCKQTTFVTSHAAFGYLAQTYDLKQLSIAGLSPEAEPTAQQLASLTEVVTDNNIGYIFTESLASPKLAETLSRETGAQILTLNPLEGLTSEEITQGATYFSVMESNLNNLQTALQCSR